MIHVFEYLENSISVFHVLTVRFVIRLCLGNCIQQRIRSNPEDLGPVSGDLNVISGWVECLGIIEVFPGFRVQL